MAHTSSTFTQPLAAITWDPARIVAVISVCFTVIFLLLAVRACRRPSPIRIRWDLARAVLSAAAIVAMAAITGVSTAVALIAMAIGAGALLGIAQGWSSRVEMREDRVVSSKTAWGVVAWGAGIIVMQAAGIASRTGALEVGQAISWMGVALLIGTIMGRQQRVAVMRSRGLVAMAFVVPVLGLAGWGSLAPQAAADDIELSGEQLCELLPWEVLDLYADAGTGEPTDRIFTFQSGIWEVEGFGLNCEYQFGGTAEGGWIGRASIWQLASRQAAFDEVALVGTDPGAGELLAPVETGIGEVHWEGYRGERLWSVASRERFMFFVAGRPQDGDIRGAMRAIDAAILELVEESPTDDPGDATDPSTADGTESPPGRNEPDAVDPGTAGEPGAAGDSDTVGPGPGVADPSLDSTDPDGDAVDRPPVTGEESEISSQSALGAALAGLTVAAAVGLISVGEAGLLSASLGGRGPWSPGEAIGIINDLWEPAPAGSSGVSSPSSPAGAGPAAAPVFQPTGASTTVYVTGAEAEAAIKEGAGWVVPIPTDQQWVPNISVEGEEPVRTGEVGTHGVIRSVGPIVRGPDGQVSVAVEVDAGRIPPPPPPVEEPPPIELEPILTPGEPAEMVPARPPRDEMPPIELDPILTPGDPVEIAPSRPPDDVVPPSVEEPAESDGGEAIPEEAAPSDETPGADDPGSGGDGPGVPTEVPGLTDRQIDDIVRWGWDRNRSPDDIRADLAAANGGIPVELPVPLEQVSTPSGPVTLTAQEAADYRDALAAAENLRQHKEWVIENMADLENEARRWSTWEQQPELRAAAGIYDVWERQRDYEAARSEINAEIARLNRRPNPYTYDSSTYSSYDEALTDWERRAHTGHRHDAISDATSRLTDLHNRHTTEMPRLGHLGEQERRLAGLREHLENLEQGNGAPRSDLFVTDDDYRQAVQDWETRDTHGQYFDDAVRTRREIAALEASIDNPIRVEAGGVERALGVPGYVVRPDADEWGDMVGIAGDGPRGVQPAVPEVEPAEWNNPAWTGDDDIRRSAFDEPARQLERIARNQEAELDTYRRIDQLLDQREQFIADIEHRAN